MDLSRIFIQAAREYNTFEKTVPAYYFRRAFRVDESCSARITVAVCGFYELFLNGSCITKGFLSPYISNTNDYIYYDEYDVTLESGYSFENGSCTGAVVTGIYNIVDNNSQEQLAYKK